MDNRHLPGGEGFWRLGVVRYHRLPVVVEDDVLEGLPCDLPHVDRTVMVLEERLHVSLADELVDRPHVTRVDLDFERVTRQQDDPHRHLPAFGGSRPESTQMSRTPSGSAGLPSNRSS